SYPTICRIAAPVNDKTCVRCRFLLCSLPLPIPSVFASFWLHDPTAIVAAAADSFCLCFFLALLWSLLLPLPSRLLTLLWSLVTGHRALLAPHCFLQLAESRLPSFNC
ncbi:hypothetical protein CISIN_1g035898mg, partial [Citrus sinensis]